MQIAQRSTSVAGITAGGYNTIDRWTLQLSSLGTWTQAQIAVTGSDEPAADGFRNSIRMLCTTNNASPIAGAFLAVTQQIEGQNLQQFAKGNANAKTFAMSFWVRSNKTGTYIVELYDNDNTRSVSSTYTIAASGTWQKVRVIFPADTTGAFSNNNTSALQVNWWLAAGSTFTGGSSLQTTWAAVTTNKRAVGQTNLADTTNNYWQMTGAQLETDSVCTPFEHEDYSVTFAKCQRYFRTLGDNANVPIACPAGFLINSTVGYVYINLATPMRSTPTGAVTGSPAYSIGSGAFGTVSSAVFTGGSSVGGYIAIGGSGLPTGAAYNFFGLLSLSAEL